MKRLVLTWTPLFVIGMALSAWLACEEVAQDDDDVAGDDDGADDDDDDDAGDDDTSGLSYPIVDSNQGNCYATGGAASCPGAGDAFYGQDAQYDGFAPHYVDNGDGTVTDSVSGLMWAQDPGDKVFHGDAVADAASFSLAGYDDWRLPSVKELYSLILFSGVDPSGEMGDDTSGLVPFMDDGVFAFEYGDPDAGERIIDSQWATTSVYGGTVMGGDECFFGVNFADGRIKCYPTSNMKSYFALYVRGNTAYGANDFVDGGDGTITDAATGLMWQQADSGQGMVWEDALAHCEALDLGGHDDWRLPGAKEFQSIVDYDRGPDTTSSAAIDPLFQVTGITNEGGQADFPCYWSSTTHANSDGMGTNAAYVAFGRALGYWMNQWQDVHGAGAQRSDPKVGDPSDYPEGHGPQGDAIRIYNHVRCVRDGATEDPDGDPAGDDDDGDDDAGDDDAGDDDTMPEPPQEAIDACTGLQLGDDCSFEPQGGPLIEGTCEDFGGYLACVPSGPPPRATPR